MFSKLMLPLTYRCNLDCEYCFVDKKSSSSINLSVALAAIDFLMKKNEKGKKAASIIFIGGEPLLEWKKMLKIILYARYVANKKGILIREIGFPTNGLLLEKKILNFCVKENIKINLSFDGEKNKRKTSKKINSFFILEKKLPLLLKYKDIIKVKMTVHPKYVEVFTDAFQKLWMLGFTKIDVQPVLGIIWTEKQKEIYLKGLKKIITSVKKRKVDVKNISTFINNQKTSRQCPKIKETFFIDLDGEIYPCDFFMGINEKNRKKYSLGNIYNGVDMQYSWQCQKHRICDANNGMPTLKEKCSSCNISQACYKICLGVSIRKRAFDPLLALETWDFIRKMEKTFKKI